MLQLAASEVAAIAASDVAAIAASDVAATAASEVAAAADVADSAAVFVLEPHPNKSADAIVHTIIASIILFFIVLFSSFPSLYSRLCFYL
jgi:glycerol uptake facilitator-like aquaporin